MNQIWILCAKCFSSWAAIQALMAFLIVWIIIQLGISGWMTTNDGGTFASHNFGTEDEPRYPFKNWESVICNADPYVYVKPFQFTYSGASSPSYCGYPTNNSDFRFVILVIGAMTVGALFFHTPLSFLARTIFLVFGLLYFASAVIDINAAVTGTMACGTNFANTQLNVYLKIAGYTPLTCSTTNVSALCAIDLIIAAQFFFLHTAWLFCKDKYIRKPGQQSIEEKALLKDYDGSKTSNASNKK